MAAKKRGKYNTTGFGDSKENILKCLSCPKPKCTNCIGYGLRWEVRQKRSESE